MHDPGLRAFPDRGIAADALDAIFAQTLGYHYFLQEWDKHSWDMAEASPITKRDVEYATCSALAELDASLFQVRFDLLTPAEKRYLRSMAGIGPGRIGQAISRRRWTKISSVAPVCNSLIAKRMLYAPAHGDATFTVPCSMPSCGW